MMKGEDKGLVNKLKFNLITYHFIDLVMIAIPAMFLSVFFAEHSRTANDPVTYVSFMILFVMWVWLYYLRFELLKKEAKK